jgi:hypothetical protein
MTEDRLEFLISEHLDGSLSSSDAEALHAALAESEQARSLLRQYESLNDCVRRSSPRLPEIRWDRLAERISGAVASVADSVAASDAAGDPSNNDDRGFIKFRIVMPRLAIAASILIAIGVGLIASRPSSRPAPATPVHRPLVDTAANAAPVAGPPLAASIEITGPSEEAAAAPPTIDIAVGPPAHLARGDEPWRYAEDVVENPSTVTIASARDGAGATGLRN